MRTSLSLSLLLAGEPDAIEQELITFFTAECAACRRDQPRRWPLLCYQHAPIARAFIEPEYLSGMRKEEGLAVIQLRELDAAITALEHVNIGLDWMRKPENRERQEQAWTRVQVWKVAIPAQYRENTILELETLRELVSQKLAGIRERLLFIEHGSQSLTQNLQRTGQERPGNGHQAATEAQATSR